MLNWNNIVPNKSMGYLPTIKNLKVELNTWQYIHDKEKPTFKVDNEQALQLLKGAGLYQSPWQCIREILQNSADASYIRLWLEKDPLESFSTPNDENFHKAVKRYPINVKIENITTNKRISVGISKAKDVFSALSYFFFCFVCSGVILSSGIIIHSCFPQ